ncbi:MAG: response regulator transcription factor [Chloroflexi bacterium]|nr:response regulator transcription factor [Chloroflexota bacterium]MDA8189608.1 response regulator transcription factor [Dehalococcoidales bacterium]
MKQIRILLADDHPVVREGLRTMLETEDDMLVVGQAEDGVALVQKARELEPDVILVDLQMPNLNGVEAIHRIKGENPETNIIILTTYDYDEYIFEGIAAGARGYLLKAIPREELFNAIRIVSRGGSLIEPLVATRLLHRFSDLARREGREDDLSEREIAVLKLMAEGARNRDIAERLCITERTAKAHVTSILQKLRASDRTEAVTRAYQKRIIQLP